MTTRWGPRRARKNNGSRSATRPRAPSCSALACHRPRHTRRPPGTRFSGGTDPPFGRPIAAPGPWSRGVGWGALQGSWGCPAGIARCRERACVHRAGSPSNPETEKAWTMADFVAVAHLDQLPPGRGIVVTVRGLAVALFNVEGTVYAMEDACRHAGASLGAGELRGTTSARVRRSTSRMPGSRASRCRSLTAPSWSRSARGFVSVLRLRRSSDTLVCHPGPTYPLSSPLCTGHLSPTLASTPHLLTVLRR